MKKTSTYALSTGQTATLLGCSPKTVCGWIDRGRLRGFRLPGSMDRRVPREALVAFLRAHAMPIPDELQTADCSLLLVGVNRMAAGLLKRLLPESEGYAITEVDGAFDAGRFAEGKTIAVVDLSAGRSLGLAIGVGLRRAGCACMICLASEDETDEAGLRRVFDVVMGKPFAVETLAERIKERK